MSTWSTQNTSSALFAALLLLPGCSLPVENATDPARSSRRGLQVDGGQLDVGPGCGNVAYVGCCAGDTLVYCTDGKLQLEECAPHSTCGWSDTFGMYVCGLSASADPSGQAPRACPTDTALDAGVDAQDSSLTDGGDGTDSTPAGECGALGYVGCCQEDQLLFCSSGKVLSLLCQVGTCGWNADGNYYDCNTAGKASPDYPKACTVVLGDAGVPLFDAAVDASGLTDGPADLTSDETPALDHRVTKDGYVVEEDGPRRPREAGPGDGAARDVVGIDALGLDAAQIDGGPGAGSGGCGGCGLGGATGVLPLPPSLLLLLGAWLIRWGRRWTRR